MKCRDPRLPAVLANESLDALTHFFGGLVGERDRQHLIRSGKAATKKMRDPMRDDARLARAGAGENEQRPLGVAHRIALFWIERGEKVLRH